MVCLVRGKDRVRGTESHRIEPREPHRTKQHRTEPNHTERNSVWLDSDCIQIHLNQGNTSKCNLNRFK